MKESLLAFAKLNLCLAVLGRRSDGFHEIESILQTIDLADQLEIDVRPGSGILVENSLSGIEGRDLAEHAAEALLARKNAPREVRIRIRKCIPAGAGLGGGSSDAACVLAALDRLVPPRLGAGALTEVAAGIGSDVPFFLVGGCARVTGRGDVVAPLPLVRSEVFMVVVPPVHCSTSDVYAAWEAHHALRSAAPALGSNDLLAPALATRPLLRGWQATIKRQGGLFSGMSGSGSSFYAAFRGREEAEMRARETRSQHPESAVFVCNSTRAGWALRTMEDT
jgi:4-diphosphocytidyl-2-C-methyl-D-erythritol kinase